jgi:signal peptidase II
MRAKRGAFFAIVVLVAAFDLWSKAEAFSRLGPPPRSRVVKLIPGVLHFETALNRGVAWGLLSEQKARWFIAGLSIVAFPLIVVCFLRAKAPTWIFATSLAGIAGGTVGNLYDRVKDGAVRDFIYVVAINFPVFNVADSFICIGATLFALEHIFTKEGAKAPEGGGDSPREPEAEERAGPGPGTS